MKIRYSLFALLSMNCIVNGMQQQIATVLVRNNSNQVAQVLSSIPGTASFAQGSYEFNLSTPRRELSIQQNASQFDVKVNTSQGFYSVTIQATVFAKKLILKKYLMR